MLKKDYEEQWTQLTVRGAFQPTIFPIENLQGPAVFQKIQLYPGRDLNPRP